MLITGKCWFLTTDKKASWELFYKIFYFNLFDFSASNHVRFLIKTIRIWRIQSPDKIQEVRFHANKKMKKRKKNARLEQGRKEEAKKTVLSGVVYVLCTISLGFSFFFLFLQFFILSSLLSFSFPKAKRPKGWVSYKKNR